MSSIDDLKNAFAGESQARSKYLAFAKKADEDGFHQVARLFRAAADAEGIHAYNHLRAMNGIGATSENLLSAISGENYEVASMYPPMIDDAIAEGNKRAQEPSSSLMKWRRPTKCSTARRWIHWVKRTRITTIMSARFAVTRTNAAPQKNARCAVRPAANSSPFIKRFTRGLIISLSKRKRPPV